MLCLVFARVRSSRLDAANHSMVEQDRNERTVLHLTAGDVRLRVSPASLCLSQ